MGKKVKKQFILFGLSLLLLAESGASELSLYTYNILSDTYITLSSYEDIDPETLNWETRKWRLVKRIHELNADILCLQEVGHECFLFLQNILKHYGLYGVFAEDAGKHQNGVATFYRKKTIRPIEVRSILCQGSNTSHKQTLRAAIITTFVLENGRKLNVINTKMRWVPQEIPLAKHPAFRQTEFLFKEVISHKPEEEWILAGDFNFKPQHPTYQLIKDQGFTEPFSEEIPTYFGNGEIKKIDYLFHTKNLAVKPLPVTDMRRAAPIPSIIEPSDHLPIGVTLIGAISAGAPG